MQGITSPSGILQPSLTDQMVGRNILFATDFSDSSARALDYALEIACRYESPLYLFHCVDPTPYNFVDSGALQTTCDDIRRELAGLVRDLSRERRAGNLQMKVLVAAGDMALILPQAVKDLSLGLIIVGTHGRTGWRKMVLGSVAEMVIDQCCCPVLCVGASSDRTRLKEVGPRNILFAGEGSALAHKYRARLTKVDVLENRSGRVRAMVSQFEWRDSEAENRWIDRAGASKQLPAEVGTESDLILQVADDISADLIVLAVPDKHRFTNRFLSTDSYRVVSNAACPVLTVRTR